MWRCAPRRIGCLSHTVRNMQGSKRGFLSDESRSLAACVGRVVSARVTVSVSRPRLPGTWDWSLQTALSVPFLPPTSRPSPVSAVDADRDAGGA